MIKEWVLRNRRILALKFAVSVALAAAHYFPENRELALITNFVWLFLF